jgi:DtxR family Mn-dependent transcriptional regulator
MNLVAVIHPLVAIGLGLVALAALAGLFWPRWGLLDRLRRSQEFMARVWGEDALKHFYHAELKGRRPTLQSLAGSLQVSLNKTAEIASQLEARELLTISGEEMRLTPEGRSYALNVVRAHRLWEQHLAEETGIAESEWHREAERKEHYISPAQADRLSARLGNPAYDPHGDPIPTAACELAPGVGTPLATLKPDALARIVHVEDEPESVYAQIRALGLYPGMTVRLLESSPQRVRFWANGQEQVLAPVVAANLSVLPVVEEAPEDLRRGDTLANLQPGQQARVTRLSPRCRGTERRRLLDLGILPGTTVRAEMVSPTGNLTAYRVRDALIALRREQAGLIFIQSVESPAA